MNSQIIGIGASLPKKCVKNCELPSNLNTSDEWISQRTGIKQRYIATDETTSTLATAAAREAIKHAGIEEQVIDLIIVATVTGDYTFPSTAVLVQKNLSIENAIAMDVSAACSGFVYALDVADSYIKLGKAKCALVIGAETFSKIVDWSDRSTCVLFGDGAGAVVLKAIDDSSKGIVYSKLYADGSYFDALITTGGVSTSQNAGFIKMEGQKVFKIAIVKFVESLNELLKANNMSIHDIDLLIPHQANSRIIQSVIEITGIDAKNVSITIDKYSNTSAATIPLALNEEKTSIFSKKNIVLLAMGAGFTWGSILIKS